MHTILQVVRNKQGGVSRGDVGLQAVVAFGRDFFERPAILHCLDCRTDSDALSSKASHLRHPTLLEAPPDIYNSQSARRT
jgi:hypothetical protein